MVLRQIRVLLCLCCLVITPAWAKGPATLDVQGVQFEGLASIPVGTAKRLFRVQPGEVSPEALSVAVKRLYASGYFSDIDVHLKGGELVVAVQERPIIQHVHFDGNEEVKSSTLEEALKKNGFYPGSVYDESGLASFEAALLAQYESGLLSATVVIVYRGPPEACD